MYQRILVAFDDSETSRCGLEQAIGLARRTGGTIRILHVIDELGHITGFETPETYYREVRPMLWKHGRQIVEDASARCVAAGVSAEIDLAECLAARVADIIVTRAESWKADLIVMGTNARRGATRVMLGSDAEQVVRTAKVPVLLARAPQASGQGATAGRR